jgi:hypothetical protein
MFDYSNLERYVGFGSLYSEVCMLALLPLFTEGSSMISFDTFFY